MGERRLLRVLGVGHCGYVRLDSVAGNKGERELGLLRSLFLGGSRSQRVVSRETIPKESPCSGERYPHCRWVKRENGGDGRGEREEGI